jgi:hypothetical protein
MAKDKSLPKVAEGNVLLLAPDGAGPCTLDGIEYAPADGFLEVPSSLCGVLIESHGYIAAE